jgi:hypothetical protein
MNEQEDFIVSINFSAQGREWLGLKSGPPTECPQPVDLHHLRYVQAGDFLRIEGMAGLWAVSHRVWHLMQDQTQLKLVLDGPIEEGA